VGGFLDDFRKKIIASVWKDKQEQIEQVEIDDKIALGVLLWVVANADEKFLAQEEDKIREILATFAKIEPKDLPFILESIKEAERQRIDLQSFTHIISNDIPYQVKISIIEILFSVGCADGDLDHIEIETIRKIAHLFGIAHKDFINAKIKIKKEFNLKTAN